MQSTELANDLLFDEKTFNQTLEKTSTPVNLFKKVLNEGNQILNDSFLAGVSVETLVYKRAWLIDQLLFRAWRYFIQSDDMTLVAVGGYGRGELHPASDIDLLILKKARSSKFHTYQLGKFLTFLWDIGLEVGHSVRTVKECITVARADITIATNIMESRILCGDKKLYDDMCNKTNPQKIWKPKKFFEEKLEEQLARHHKYDDTDHKLEPNIKESPGGLRDIQMIGWVAKRHFDADTLHELVKHKFLTEEEYKTLETGQKLLWKIRYALHYITHRHEDRLLFEYQKNLAQFFGFQSEDNSDVESFMKMYYRTVRELNLLNEILLQHFQEAIIYGNSKSKLKPLNSRFQIRNNFLEVRNKNVFQRYPFALLELFLLLQQNPSIKGVRASTIRLIRSHRELINKEFRNDIRNRSLFMEIIRQPRKVGHELRRMHRYGILSKYLPVFGNIQGLMQFDLFHIYTVDEHILFVVRNMRLFGMPDQAIEHPLYCKVQEIIPKQELLYLAGLFHDIAKGRGGDHSELGSKDAYKFCKKHGLSNYDAELVSWLVENHLLMSKTAQRMDISDPEVINEFAAKIGDRNHLNYLYLLTVADIQGTNPVLWNNWKDALLADLYHKTLLALRRGLENPLHKDVLIRETRDEALNLINKAGAKQLKIDINTFWDSLGEDYFLRHSPDEIAWHTRAIDKSGHPDKPLIVVREKTSRGGTEVFIYMKNQDNIFAATTQTLDRLGFSIVDARIITSTSDYTLDTYIILEDSGDVIKDKHRKLEIIQSLEIALTTLKTFTPKIMRTKSRRMKHFPIPTRINFTSDEKNDRTIMEVISSDRPGFLSRIGMALQFCGVPLQGAKIATYGAKVEDIFFITDKNNHLIKDPIKFECLKNSIIDILATG